MGRITGRKWSLRSLPFRVAWLAKTPDCTWKAGAVGISTFHTARSWRSLRSPQTLSQTALLGASKQRRRDYGKAVATIYGGSTLWRSGPSTGRSFSQESPLFRSRQRVSRQVRASLLKLATNGIKGTNRTVRRNRISGIIATIDTTATATAWPVGNCVREAGCNDCSVCAGNADSDEQSRQEV